MNKFLAFPNKIFNVLLHKQSLPSCTDFPYFVQKYGSTFVMLKYGGKKIIYTVCIWTSIFIVIIAFEAFNVLGKVTSKRIRNFQNTELAACPPAWILPRSITSSCSCELQGSSPVTWLDLYHIYIADWAEPCRLVRPCGRWGKHAKTWSWLVSVQIGGNRGEWMKGSMSRVRSYSKCWAGL